MSRAELSRIVQFVFVTMLSLGVDDCGPPWFPSGDRLTSALLLECSPGMPLRRPIPVHGLYGALAPNDAPSDIVDDDVRDVLGELANMIGGNMKSVLGAGIRLSMPTVVDGSDASLRVCGAQVRERLAFQSAVGPFWVTVLAAQS